MEETRCEREDRNVDTISTWRVVKATGWEKSTKEGEEGSEVDSDLDTGRQNSQGCESCHKESKRKTIKATYSN